MKRTRIGSALAAAVFLAGSAAVAWAQGSPGAPEPLAGENDVNCFGFVGPENLPVTGTLVSGRSATEQSAFMIDDIVYANVQDGVQAGSEFWFVSPMDEVVNPNTGEYLGRFYEYLGYGKAICVRGETAILQIEFACTDVPLGVELLPYEPIPVPLGRVGPAPAECDPASGKRVGTIVYSRDGVEGMGAGNDCIVDMGADANLSPGDILTIFRYNHPREFDIAASGDIQARRLVVQVPRTVLGQAAVLTVGDRTATVHIVSSTQTISPGDFVEIP